MSVFTDWEIYPLAKPIGSLRANGKVTICQTVKVSFTIMEGSKGLFAGLPSKLVEKNGERKYYPDVKLIDETTYEQFQTEAKEAYSNRLESGPPAKKTISAGNVPF